MDKQISSPRFAKKLVQRAEDQLRHLCCIDNFLKELHEKEGELIKKCNDLDTILKDPNKQAIDVPVVHAWLERRAKHLKVNVENLRKKTTTRINKRHCFVQCPNWVWRYRMANKLVKKKVQVENCIKDGDNYIKVDNAVSFIKIQNLASEKALVFDSRKHAYEQLMEALKDDSVTMIGLYGMGGCGKTTMAEQLKRAVEADNLFQQVALVTVSNNEKLEIRSIQDNIAKAVFPFLKEKEDESKRAETLREILSNEHKRSLVILDDVWKEFDLDCIGVPSRGNHKNCKVLITTRPERVCDLMNCERKIALSTLTDEEAWILFLNQAHMSERTDDTLKLLGRQISDECKGLPVAIAAIASTLKDKGEDEWKAALNALRKDMLANVGEDLRNPYKCLQVSYDNLDNEEAKSILLLCSVFPEDYEIPIELLIRIAIGLGLVGEFSSFEETRDKTSEAIEKLISSSLLLTHTTYDRVKHVKMHDLVRDVAIWIAKEEGKAVKCMLEKDDSFDFSSIRYLWCKEVANAWDCSGIEFLCIGTTLQVSGEIFQTMERLRVLFLVWEGGGRGSLSTTSFKSLTNLQSLILVWWKLGDISFMGHLIKLESLTLHDCSFFELPDVVATQLKNLRLLHLTSCLMEMNPEQVFGKLPQLEELYFSNEVLSQNFTVPQGLRRYIIFEGDKHLSMAEFCNDQIKICISSFDKSNATLDGLAKNAEVLWIKKFEGSQKNFIPDIFEIEGGCKWDELDLSHFEEIECVVDASDHSQDVGSLFSKLRKLSINSMKNLRFLYRGVPPIDLFTKLEVLDIFGCPALTCLFTLEVAQSLVSLERLKIEDCDKLKHLLGDSGIQSGVIWGHNYGLVFSKLKEIQIKCCDMMEYLIPITFAQSLARLESLYIYGCFELKYVFGQPTRVDRIQHQLKIEFPALDSLYLEDNFNLMSLFPTSCSMACPLLHRFHLLGCQNVDMNTFKATGLKIAGRKRHLETFHPLISLKMHKNSKTESIFILDGLVKIGNSVNLQLQSLELHYVEQMKYICKAGAKNSFGFRNLITLEIIRCSKLEVVFSTCVVRLLPELQYLKIWDCQELKEVVEEDVENKNLSSLVTSPPCFPKLVSLLIYDCHNLKHLSCVLASKDSPSLQTLIIVKAKKLEELIGSEQGNVNVELPKTLKLVAWVNLSNLSQEIELPATTTCFVHGCLKLSLTSSIATLDELESKVYEVYRGGGFYLEPYEVMRIIDDEVENSDGESGTTIQVPQIEEGSTSTHSSVSGAAEHHLATKDNLVAKIIAELEECLKMPVKDIAISEANSLRLLTPLKSLFDLSFQDANLSGDLKKIIDSLHQEFPSILNSFKRVSSATRKLAMLEEKEKSIKENLSHRNDVATKTEEKEEAETARLENELQNVSGDKSYTMEEQRKAQQELFQVNYKWWDLCHDIRESNRFSDINPS